MKVMIFESDHPPPGLQDFTNSSV